MYQNLHLFLGSLKKMKLLFISLLLFWRLLDHGASGVDIDGVLLMEGDYVTLHTGVKTNQQDKIQWYFNDIRIAQITGDLSKICTDVQCNEDTERFRGRLKLDHQTGSLTIMNSSTTDSGVYKLLIRSSNIDSENSFSVIVLGFPAAERDKMKIKSVKEGESVTLDADVVNIPNDLTMWYLNDTCIILLTGNRSEICTDDHCVGKFRDRLKLNQTGSLTITNTRNTDSGLYKLQISSSRFSIVKTFSVTVTALTDSTVAAVAATFVFAVLLVAAAGGIYCHCNEKRTRDYNPDLEHNGERSGLLQMDKNTSDNQAGNLWEGNITKTSTDQTGIMKGDDDKETSTDQTGIMKGDDAKETSTDQTGSMKGDDAKETSTDQTGSMKGDDAKEMSTDQGGTTKRDDANWTSDDEARSLHINDSKGISTDQSGGIQGNHTKETSADESGSTQRGDAKEDDGQISSAATAVRVKEDGGQISSAATAVSLKEDGGQISSAAAAVSVKEDGGQISPAATAVSVQESAAAVVSAKEDGGQISSAAAAVSVKEDGGQISPADTAVSVQESAAAVVSAKEDGSQISSAAVAVSAKQDGGQISSAAAAVSTKADGGQISSTAAAVNAHEHGSQIASAAAVVSAQEHGGQIASPALLN
ncbi:uncharacterized protein [Garra rufa]|uniref:uncharacterized protein n=1 Tax=Garra rufa TaxID=137080 RepID=UPI003CCEE742